jgi:predicted metal-dependent phosphoesterase TrpH
MHDQLETALQKGINAIFITNHNTLDGYRQVLSYQRDHARFSGLSIYPAEEITVDTGGHVLAYGIYETIRANMTLEETLDEIHRQGGISCAAHPFAVTNGIREKALMCDMIESFNSNNIDRHSNIVAGRFARDNNMVEVAGSDSHVLATIGRCVNTIDCENNLDSILHAMSGGRIKVMEKDYASQSDIYEHAYYIINSSRDLLLAYALQNYPRHYRVLKWALGSYVKNPHSTLWRSIASLTLYLTKRVSEKVNMKGHNPKVFENRQWDELISMGLFP